MNQMYSDCMQQKLYAGFSQPELYTIQHFIWIDTQTLSSSPIASCTLEQTVLNTHFPIINNCGLAQIP